MLARLLRLIPSKPLEGYENPELVSEIYKKTLAAEPTESWPEIRGTNTVIDFGGACGIHYKAARREAPLIRWAVVETPAMVREASNLSTDQLKFFDSIDAAAAWLGHVDLIYSSGALQYTSSPMETVEKLAHVGATKIQWRRLFLSDRQISEHQRSMLIENGPSFRFSTKAVVYERKSLSRVEFENAHRGYRVEASGPDWFDFVR